MRCCSLGRRFPVLPLVLFSTCMSFRECIIRVHLLGSSNRPAVEVAFAFLHQERVWISASLLAS